MPNPGRLDVDWIAVRAAFEAGTQSVRALAATFGVSPAAVRKRARRGHWRTHLGSAVAAATRAALAEAEGRVPAPRLVTMTALPAKEAAAAVHTAAAAVVAVQRLHRRTIRDAAARLDTLDRTFDALLAAEPPTSFMQLEAAVDVLDRVTKITERLVKLERTCWGLDAEKPGDADDRPRLAPDQLRAIRETLEARVQHSLTVCSAKSAP